MHCQLERQFFMSDSMAPFHIMYQIDCQLEIQWKVTKNVGSKRIKCKKSQKECQLKCPSNKLQKNDVRIFARIYGLFCQNRLDICINPRFAAPALLKRSVRERLGTKAQGRRPPRAACARALATFILVCANFAAFA